ncbi:cadherin-like protein 26 [Alligator mississippiensis]|uniref:Cadherin-like protein 26 n=1 Tax=Alligator mississippiensis TaxID=8496 RepID=A0A151NZK1_ALLMI|nr:cadherin-like protein 26 [Alligator mississippiensis]
MNSHTSSIFIRGHAWRKKVTCASNLPYEKEDVTQELTNEAPELYRSDSLRPLRRTKRAWVITTMELQEEDEGPFPKLVGELFNNNTIHHFATYLISGPGVDLYPDIGLFSIKNDADGRIYVHRSIDRERNSSFLIRFDVTNKKTGEKIDTSLFFRIKIKDINDNAPEFPMAEYNVMIKENHSADKPVLQMTAFDKDEQHTDNSRVAYYLTKQTPLSDEPRFTIDPTSGLIHISGCLNYAAASSFQLLIEARDHGSPRMSSTAIVNVAVEDSENNYLPVFLKEKYELQIPEGKEQPGALRLQVKDLDSPYTPAWRAKYNIVQGNEKEEFMIETDPETNEGILSVIKPLDYEGAIQRRLVISAVNEQPIFTCNASKKWTHPVTPITASVSVSIVRNDAPQFDPPILILQKDEGVKPGTKLGKYTAVDSDVVPNKMKYRVVHDPAGWVNVDENTGLVTAVKELDRESPYVNNSVYSVIVHAVDDGVPPQTGTGTILLYLSDINDNTPKLVAPFLEVCDQEGIIPLIIKAEDNDLDPYSGPFIFELADNSDTVKHNWKLGRRFGDSVELLMLRNLSPGDYLVPLNILDRQGFSETEILNIRVCLCQDGHTCSEQITEPMKVGFESGAIAAILATLLLLLSVTCVLLWCTCASRNKERKVYPPFEEGIQTLMNYNAESGSSWTQASPDAVDHAMQLILHTEIKGGEQIDQVGNTKLLPPPLKLSQGHYDLGSSGILYSRSDASFGRLLSRITETVDEMLNEKLFHISNLEDNVIVYQPRVYVEEGELDRCSSCMSIPVTDDELPVDFLNTLGPKFTVLEEICQKRFQL